MYIFKTSDRFEFSFGPAIIINIAFRIVTRLTRRLQHEFRISRVSKGILSRYLQTHIIRLYGHMLQGH